jgi:hypothetical protein
MKRKGLLLLVLATLIAGGAFAQKVGDTIQAGGSNWTVQSVSDNTMVLQKVPTLDGTWKRDDGLVVTFNGNAAVYNQLSTSALYQDAKNKGHVKIGDQMFRNLNKTSGLTWSVQVRTIQFKTNAPNVATGTNWGNDNIALSVDGKSFQTNNGSVFTRQ